jgi:hypothetical protein
MNHSILNGFLFDPVKLSQDELDLLNGRFPAKNNRLVIILSHSWIQLIGKTSCRSPAISIPSFF